MAGSDRLIAELVAKNERCSALPRELPERQDGEFWHNALDWKIFAGVGAWTNQRVGAGDYRVYRIAGGAETHQLVYTSQNLTRRTDARGVKVIGIALAYEVSTVALTSLTIDPRLVTYATGGSITNAAYGGTMTYDAANDTDAERKAVGQHLLELTFAEPKYICAPNAQTAIEHAIFSIDLEIVLANTGLFALWGGGPMVAHDYI